MLAIASFCYNEDMNRCIECGDPCPQRECDSCKRSARYGKDLLNCPSPFNSDWKETDTSLSTDFSGAKLIYKAERHTDELTGAQLGDIINLDDLRNVDTDTDTAAHCSEIIFRRYGECGAGCKSMEDKWKIFSLDDDGALTDGLRYVRGVNAYGCPQFLDTPDNLNEFWYAGWRLDGDHRMFGYYQARKADKLPKDENGNYLVGSYDLDTKEPIVAPLPLDCIIGNIMGNLGMDITAEFEKTQEYKYITGDMKSNGEFEIFWEDWYYNMKQHVGDGTVRGQVIWTSKFDTQTGNMSYVISGIRYDNVSYKVYEGAPSTAEPIFLTLKAIDLNTGAQTMLVDRYQFSGSEVWNININRTFNVAKNFTVRPGETQGPMPFIYIFVDWESTFDDEGNMNLYLHNKVSHWSLCD